MATKKKALKTSIRELRSRAKSVYGPLAQVSEECVQCVKSEGREYCLSVFICESANALTDERLMIRYPNRDIARHMLSDALWRGMPL